MKYLLQHPEKQFKSCWLSSSMDNKNHERKINYARFFLFCQIGVAGPEAFQNKRLINLYSLSM